LVFSYGSRAADVSRAADGGFGVEPARLTAFTGMNDCSRRNFTITVCSGKGLFTIRFADLR
jgi:hypothetical protein